MKTYTFHNELHILLAQVLNALGDLVIRRLREDPADGTFTDTMDVGLKWSPKQRIIYDLTNQNQHTQVPVMALTMSNIVYDKQRTFNKISGFTLSEMLAPSGGRYPQPVPVTINLNLSILTRYQRDMDQILTCIFSQFHPYIILSYKHPDYDGEVRCALTWSGSVSFTYPIDATASTSYRIVGDSVFTLEGWIFKNANNPYGIIHKIDTSFTSVSSLFDDYDIMHSKEDATVTDQRTISGRPQLFDVLPNSINIIDNTSRIFNINGDMLDFVTDLAVIPTLSTNYFNMFNTSSYKAFDPFMNSTKLSAVYPAFTAVPVLSTNWQHVDNNNISFSIPQTLTGGYLDVYAWDSMGLGKLTLDSRRDVYNPYVSGSSEYNNYIGYQLPIVSGVNISN